MAYLLSPEDRQRITCLEKLGGRILKRLHVPFTRPQLAQTLYRNYIRLLSPPANTPINAEEVTVADRNDPSNLALVLLEAMKEYYVHSTIADTPEIAGTKVTLVILTKNTDTQTFDQLLGLAEKEERDRYTIQRIALPRIPLQQENIENYVVFERSGYSSEENYEVNSVRQKLRRAFLTFIAFLLSGIVTSAILHAGQQYPPWLWLPTVLMLAAGIFVSINLFRLEKMNAYLSDWVRKVCSAGKEINCQKVVGSAGAKWFGVISMTDIGTIYFCGMLGFAILGLLNSNTAQYLAIIGWCSVLALPYTLYLVYYQASVLKKICPLCMAVHGILWVHAVYLLTISTAIPWRSITVPLLVELLVIMTIVASIYFLVVFHLRLQLQYSRLQTSEESLRNDPVVFTTLLERQPSLDAPELPGIIMLGNRDAIDRIDVVLSLTCSACGDKLKELQKFAAWFGDAISIAIHVKPDPYNANVIKKQLEHSLQNNYAQAIDVLTDWFNLLKTNPTPEAAQATGRQRHEVVLKQADVDYVYELYMDWHGQHFIPHTPFLLYNGRVVPNEYNHLPRLKIVIEQIQEQQHETEEQP